MLQQEEVAMAFQNLMFANCSEFSVDLAWSRVLGQGPPEVPSHQKDSVTLLPVTTLPCVLSYLNCALLYLFASLSCANLSILAAMHTQEPHGNTS